jgi:hypothetical protein
MPINWDTRTALAAEAVRGLQGEAMESLKDSGWTIPKPASRMVADPITHCSVNSEPVAPQEMLYVVMGPTGTQYLACQKCYEEIK